MHRLHALLGTALAGAATLLACGSSSVGPSEPDGEIPAVFRKFAATVEVSLDGDYVVLRSDGVPDHGSPYFAPSDPKYEAYDGANPGFVLNPNRIEAQEMVVRIPLHPRQAAAPQPTPLGPIGMAVNGVAIFNQYAGPNRPLGREIDSFDQYNGHPQQTGVYHYHVEPLHLSRTKGSDALVGFLLDGFPVYGPVENGRRVTNADLDALHGHFGATADYPQGVYHYHVTSEDPYINGAGFYGVPGTASR
ncbi:MAG TPA: YHYH protein [Longimicrobium sp.]|jgi:hypothetical protein